MFGSDNQNRNLSDAAAKRVDTSPRTVTSNKYAARVTSNIKKGSGVSGSVTSAEKTSVDYQRPDPVKGSFEGLDKSKSTYIQPDDTGYASKLNQQARYKDKTIKNFTSPTNGIGSLANVKKSGIITNYSSRAAKNSSTFKLNSMLDINKLF